MHVKFLGAAAVVALSSLTVSAALAGPITTSGTVDGGYSYVDANGGGGHANDWNINGAVVVPVTPNLAVQANGGYNYLQGSGDHQDAGNGVASLIYNDHWGRVGASVGYAQLTEDGLRADATNYGVFGDWYADDRITLSARGGGLSGSLHGFGARANYSGAYYVGGQAVAYALPDLGFTGTIDYVNLGSRGINFRTTDYGVGVEYLLSKDVPVSVGAGYTYTDENFAGDSFNTNTFSLRVKYYFGAHGSLVDHQRTGSENWGASAPIQNLF